VKTGVVVVVLSLVKKVVVVMGVVEVVGMTDMVVVLVTSSLSTPSAGSWSTTFWSAAKRATAFLSNDDLALSRYSCSVSSTSFIF